jgi:hypothetical protein
MKFKLSVLTATALILAGCASSGVIQVGQDRYMISDSNSMYWTGGSVMKDILQEAKAFCAKKGKSLELLGNKTSDATAGIFVSSVASAQIEFTCK